MARPRSLLLAGELWSFLTMIISRRGFFSAVSTALVGGLVAHKVPIGWLPPPVRRAGVLGYLTELCNDFGKAHGRPPIALYISRTMFEQFEKELTANERFGAVGHMGTPSLKFKSIEVGVSENGMTLIT